MRLFVIPPGWEGGPRLLLGGEGARHLGRVLRLRPGDSFAGVDPDGTRRRLEVLEAGRGSILLAVGPPDTTRVGDAPLPDARSGKGRHRDRHVSDGAPGPFVIEAHNASMPPGQAGIPRITLAIGILKGEKMDLVVRQAAEAGVAEIRPLLTARSIGGEGAAGRRGRWERIIREARQQSGSAVPTRVTGTLCTAAFIAGTGPLAGAADGRIGILFHEAPLSAPLLPAPPSHAAHRLAASPLAVAALHGYLGPTPGELILSVGPEGGFTPEEVVAFTAAGFLPLRLPGAVLRAETAALYAVAAVQITLAERRAWNPRP